MSFRITPKHFRVRSADGALLSAELRLPRKKSQPYPVIVLLHGLASRREHPLIQRIANSLTRENYAVVLFDFSGHGRSSRKISYRRVLQFVHDTEHVLSWVRKQPQLDEKKIILGGHSVGALTSLVLAAKDPKLAGVFMIGSNAETDKLYEQMLAAGLIKLYKTYSLIKISYWHRVAADFWINRKKYPPLKLVVKIRAPKLFIVGAKDPTNPPSESRKLLRASSGSKKLVVVPGAGHHFLNPKHSQAVTTAINTWLKSII